LSEAPDKSRTSAVLRSVTRILAALAVVGVLVVVVFVGLFFWLLIPSVREVNRIPNPGMTLDAVLAEKETDATVATPIVVYVVAHGGDIDESGLVFQADHVQKLSAVWSSDDQLVITADQARVFRHRPNQEVSSRRGRVALRVSLKVKTLEPLH